jgi:hypothetical protein
MKGIDAIATVAINLEKYRGRMRKRPHMRRDELGRIQLAGARDGIAIA